MNELYSKLDRLDYSRDNELITVIRGGYAGAKILLTDGQLQCADRIAGMRDLDALPEDALFREKLGHVQTLVVCGAGTVGQAVIRIAKFLGWRVICVEDRPEFAKAADAAGADDVLLGEFQTELKKIPRDEDLFFVVVTREHCYDRACLDQILPQPFGYLGMMGSHRRAAQMKASLREAGWPDDVIARLHAPVGLEIEAQTEEEIAVSIAAEMILEKERSEGRYHFPDDILQAVLRIQSAQETDPSRHAVLATVTRQIGSTPRKPGARMLVYPDASILGTVGGGSMEAEVIRKSVRALEKPEDFAPCLLTVDLTGRSGGYADMLCGGLTEIFMELI